VSKVGFIGLGVMGGPMAANLVAAGHRVVGHNRSEGAVRRLVEAGGEAAGSIAEAVEGAEHVITMLPDSPDVEAVVLGPDGVFATAAAGLHFTDMSTIRPDVARRIAREGAEASRVRWRAPCR
jgi:2-hydroxy-3-oxopropionate reductase